MAKRKTERHMNKIQEEIKLFVDSDKTTMTFSSITIEDIRDLYRSRNSQHGELEYYIFNSMWNREPNYSQTNVVKDKVGYAFRIGIGIASYNLLPLSWINSLGTNLLMKDRGHILELVCGKYNQKFSTLTLRKILKYEIELIKEANKQWVSDEQAKKAIDTANKIDVYLNSEIKKAKKAQLDSEVSLKDICDNVSEFDNGINRTQIPVEVRKESIFFHMQEILRINNGQNQWIAYQKSFLELCSYAYHKDGSEKYLHETLDIDALRGHIKTLSVFTGDSKIDIIPMYKGVSSYYKKLDESVYFEPIAFRYLGMRCTYTEFENRATAYYVSDGPKGDVLEISKQLKGLRDKQLKLNDAKRILKEINTISEDRAWEKYHNIQKQLVDDNDDGILKMNNLEDSDITKEDFGMACVDACLEIAYKNGINRTSPSQLAKVVEEFVDCLIKQLKNSVNTQNIFSGAASMEWRFNNIIRPAYEAVIENRERKDGKTENADKIYSAHMDELKKQFAFNGQTTFEIINPIKDWENNPQIVTITFDKNKGRAECGLDIGHKKQTEVLTVDNSFLQVRGENRSQNKQDHMISNIDYWLRFAREKQNRVSKIESYLVKNKEYGVLNDSGKLIEVFTKPKNK